VLIIVLWFDTRTEPAPKMSLHQSLADSCSDLRHSPLPADTGEVTLLSTK